MDLLKTIENINLSKYKKDFIKFMLDSKVLSFGDFTTKSGRKTPYFINTGKYKTGYELSKLGEFYAHAINENFDLNKLDIVFGPAYKGIPIVTSTSIKLKELYNKDINFVFNRKEVKDHGEGGSFVGSPLLDNDNLLILEDVTTAGTSIYETVPLLKQKANINLIGLLVSVDRQEKTKDSKDTALKRLSEEFNMKTTAIVSIYDIVKYLYTTELNGIKYLDDNLFKAIENYLTQYGA